MPVSVSTDTIRQWSCQDLSGPQNFNKKADSHSYLLYSSSHPPSCINSIPSSQLLRAKRICSKEADFDNAASMFNGFFRSRGYPPSVITTANQRINLISRESTLEPTNDVTNTDRIPLTLPFHPLLQHIRHTVYRNFKALTRDPTTKEVFTEMPITAYKRLNNLADHLVRASHPQPIPVDTPGTYPCNRSRCNTCKYVTSNIVLRITGPKNSFIIKHHFSCISTNVIYVIICQRCNLLYIGETKRRLADCITEHLRSIKSKFPGYPVASHFNSPSPCKITDFSVTCALFPRGTDIDRLKSENRLIFGLGTLSPYDLNSKFDLL
ncbi:uncharacterized protein [Apostichopus japonicus]|uniref:uncharacterized protein isoform X1 n=1 Tax=Stichopus japonicus TaxID=307972 RepID=UPI003AB8C751